MGDADATASFPDVKASVIDAALDWGMAQKAQNTRAIVFVYRGKIVGERYAPGWSKDTPEIGWSEGKSITGALIGILVEQGVLTLDEPAPIKEWHRQPGDPRAQIRVRNLMNMSSGLDFANLQSRRPGVLHAREQAHARLLRRDQRVRACDQQRQEIPPNTKQRYRNSDPLSLGKIVRDKVEARGENYLTFPQRALFDRIGIRNATLETDAWGNFIMSGFDYRLGARLGAVRAAPSAGRHVARPAHSPRRVDDVRVHARAGGSDEEVRRDVLGESRARVGRRSGGRLLARRCDGTIHGDHSVTQRRGRSDGSEPGRI